MWWEVILDALIDTLKLFPFLLLLYVLIEVLEHKTRMGKPSRLLTGRAAPAIGAATGLVPMCGFSVMAAKLYRHRHLSLGALLAVFAATSDEGLLVLLLSSAPWSYKLLSAAALLGCKFVFGVAVGYLADAIFRRATVPLPEPVHGRHGEEGCHVHVADVHDEESHTHVHNGDVHDEESHTHVHVEEVHDEEHHAHAQEAACGCAELSACEHKHESPVSVFLLSPLWHALEVAGFVLLVNLLFGFLFFGLGGGSAEEGEALVSEFMQGAGYWFQPLLCSAVGLIPNCASSVAIAETYAIGGIGFGGLLGGLVSNAGLGYLVLFKGGKVREGLLIMLFMFLAGVAVGYAAAAVCLLI